MRCLWAVCVLGVAGVLRGQTGPPNDVVFRVVPPQTTMSLTVELVTEHTQVTGWSFGLCHDPDKARILEFEPADELNFLLFGGPVGYLAYRESVKPGVAGVFQGVVVSSLRPEDQMPPVPVGPFPDGLPLMHVRYEITEDSQVWFCERLGEPPVRNVVVDDRDNALQPARLESGLFLAPHFEEELVFQVAPRLSDGPVKVQLVSPTAAVQGWSFSLCHWEDKAHVVEILPAEELDIIKAGDPVDFLALDVVPGDRLAGVTQAVVIDFGGVAFGPFPKGLDLLYIRYDVRAETDIAFCELTRLDPPVANVVVIEGQSYEPKNLLGGHLVVGGLSPTFIRGDVSGDGRVDLADAIRICCMAAGLGSVPCADAADVDDNGRVDLADAVFLLRYLFAGGRPPASPFPRPGPDLTTQDDLDCRRY